MRNLVLLLVLLNLGVLAWFAWIVPAPQPVVAWDGPGITLLRELDADAPIVVASRRQLAPAAASSDLLAVPASEPDEPSVSSATCVAVGPFTEAAQAEAAVANLNSGGIAASLRVEQQEIWEGYWVYVAGMPSVEAANSALARLAANGIADAYVIPNSDSGILISLGVFSEVARAGAQAERAGSFGLSPTITERIRTEETHWIELDMNGEESRALELLQEPGRISRIEQRECRAGL